MPLVRLAPKEKKVTRAIKVMQVQLVRKAQLVQQVLLETKEIRAIKVM